MRFLVLFIVALAPDTRWYPVFGSGHVFRVRD
jgi:hypothetical protein